MNDLYILGFRDGEATANARIEMLERLIERYAAHVVCCGPENVTYLGGYYRVARDTPGFTDEEWNAIRLLAKENNG